MKLLNLGGGGSETAWRAEKIDKHDRNREVVPPVTADQRKFLEAMKAKLNEYRSESEMNEGESSAGFHSAVSDLEKLADELRKSAADVFRWQPSMEIAIADARAWISSSKSSSSIARMLETSISDWDALQAAARRTLGAADAVDNLVGEFKSLRRRANDSVRDLTAHFSDLIDLRLSEP